MIYFMIVWTIMSHFENLKIHHNVPLPKCVHYAQLCPRRTNGYKQETQQRKIYYLMSTVYMMP